MKRIIPDQPTPEPGIYPDVPEDEYHAWDAMSQSWLGVLDTTTPKHFRHRRLHPPAPTAAMRFGTVLHTLLLSPFDFGTRFAIAPNAKKNVIAGKKKWAAFEEALDGREPVTSADYRKASAMAKAIRAFGPADNLLTGGQAEMSVVWDDDETGIRCKLRTDYWNSPLIVDVKTTLDANPDVFTRSLWNYGYHRQVAMYLDGMPGADDFMFVAVEKTPPYDVLIRPAGKTIYEAGRMSYKRALFLLKDCRERDEWPGYGESTKPLDFPEWVLRQEGLEQEMVL